MVAYTVIIVTAIIMLSLIVIVKIVVASDKDNEMRFRHNKDLEDKSQSNITFEIDSISKNNSNKK
ncbi:hypothetical protein HMPREF1092_03258 [Clostridium thermobutyricum]|uniref:YtzI protein n=1 Tax=Clostridium thermobutyricum TaxID=29372 RepID=N9XS59_9CLOT|nr:hypothetical protein [Clostridium thermobutyricum]ENY98778.1 hypothetical protein HMPREF1092_03258 [Clostridium thermobutyricum]